MTNSHDRRALLIITDGLIAAAAFLIAGWVRFGPDFRSAWESELQLPALMVFVPALTVVVVALFGATGVYRAEARWNPRTEAFDILKATALTALVLMSALYFFRLEDVSRKTFAGFLLGLALGSIAVRFALSRWALPRAHAVRVLFVGTDGAARILERIRQVAPAGVELVGFLGHDTPDLAGAMQRLGDLMDLPRILSTEVVDEVIVCLPVDEWRRLDEIAGVCEEQGKVMRVPVDVVAYSLRRSRVEDLDGVPLLSLVSGPTEHLALAVKRVFDLVVSMVLLVILLPLLVGVAVGLLITQGRPVFFAQTRGGLNGRPFRVLKFRTMVHGAQEGQDELVALNERIGPAFKITDDPRVTRLGRWLRKTSLDEVPQLWNVVRGEMSLVGPRPQPLSEVARYDPWHRRRLTVKPGITGLWQITSRDDPSFDRWVDLDLQYIDQWSVWLDLRILARTPGALIRTPGT